MTLSLCALWCRDISVIDALWFAGPTLPNLVLSKRRELTFAYHYSLSDCSVYIERPWHRNLIILCTSQSQSKPSIHITFLLYTSLFSVIQLMWSGLCYGNIKVILFFSNISFQFQIEVICWTCSCENLLFTSISLNPCCMSPVVHWC